MVEVLKSDLNDEKRIDAQYFQKKYLYEDSCRKHFRSVALGTQAFITDGPHGYHEVDSLSPIAMLTAKCAKDWFADRSGADAISMKTHQSSLRSSLQVDDLILSTRGTVGACAIVELDILPVNIDQDVARISLGPTQQFLPKFLLAYLNSRFGQDWIERNSTGMVQQGLSLAKVRELPVPLLSLSLQAGIAEAISQASENRRVATASLASAEISLLRTLGLENWKTSEPLSYVRHSSEAFAAGRLDAEYFRPRVLALMDLLGRDGLTVDDVAPARHEIFKPREAGATFDYIEIGDMRNDGTVGATELATTDAPSRATQHVRAGDVLTSTVRPIRRLSAVVGPTQDGAVCSSGFVVLNPIKVSPSTLVTYLRLPGICELMDLHTSASLYPAISERDLLRLPIPHISEAAQQAIDTYVGAAHSAKQRATQLLEAAKRAVEIAIEASEAAALAYVHEVVSTVH